MEPKLFLIPIIGFVIGAFTNYLAIKLVFHPKRKILGIQGLLPKRKSILAKNIGDTMPEIMPPYFKKIEHIPIIGNQIIRAFKHSVETQINNMDIEELEKIILRVMHKELNFLVWIGGILGFLIGLVQLAIIL